MLDLKKYFSSDNADFKLEKPSSDLVPYACHYDNETLLTKNGELIQMMRIRGVSPKVGRDAGDIRDAIREAIFSSIKTQDFAFWIHTVRSKVDLTADNHFDSLFAEDTHNSWCKKNYWREKFVNELYISIVYTGKDYSLKDRNILRDSLSIRDLKQTSLSYLESARKIIGEAVGDMLSQLSDRGAELLTVKEDRLGSRSEQLEFLSKIIHLNEKRMPMPIMDLSEYLTKHKAAFGNNTFEIEEEGTKFGAVFSVKEYNTLSGDTLDGILRLPQEFIITQSFTFVDKQIATSIDKYQDYIYTVSKSEGLRKKLGLADFMTTQKQRSIEYCSQQIVFTLIADNQQELEVAVENTTNRMNALGHVFVREDLFAEQCFWGQLPANFSFRSRTSYISTKSVASFASLKNSPFGAVKNPWGGLLTIFRTDNGTPYFFNFHFLDRGGNTLIMGPEGVGKSVLVNFLITLSTKYTPRIFYIDQFKESQVTLNLLGGVVHEVSGSESSIKFNPFAMKDDINSRTFLERWLCYILYSTPSDTPEAKKENIKKMVDKIYSLPQEKRKISSLVSLVKDKDAKTRLSKWCGKGKYSAIFDNEKDEFDPRGIIQGFHVEELLKAGDEVSMPVMIYMVYRFTLALDGKPSILIFNDARNIFKNPAYAEELKGWSKYLTKANAIGVFVKDTEDLSGTGLEAIIPDMVTKIFMPDTGAPERYQKTLGLSNLEINKIKELNPLYRHIMVRKGGRVVIAELNLDGMEHAIGALSGTGIAIKAMEKAKAETKSDNANKWLIPFYNYLIPKNK